MITTDYVPGSPSWLDLGTPDVAAAAAFYGGVFGWELRPMGKNPSGYGAFLLEGRTAAAVGLLTEEGAVPAWTVYFTTTDAQATARAVVSAGGSVRVPPTKLGEEATFAQFSDPAGGQFAVFRPGRGQGGIEAVDEPGALVWVEYCTPDPAAAREFYGSVFGWQTDEMTVPGGGGSYTMLTPAGESQQRPARRHRRGAAGAADADRRAPARPAPGVRHGGLRRDRGQRERLRRHGADGPQRRRGRGAPRRVRGCGRGRVRAADAGTDVSTPPAAGDPPVPGGAPPGNGRAAWRQGGGQQRPRSRRPAVAGCARRATIESLIRLVK